MWSPRNPNQTADTANGIIPNGASSTPSILSPEGRHRSKSPRPSITFSTELNDLQNTPKAPTYTLKAPSSILTAPLTPRLNNPSTSRRRSPVPKKSISFRPGDFVLLTLSDSVWGIDSLHGPDAFTSPHQRKLSLEGHGVTINSSSLKSRSSYIQRVITEEEDGTVVETVNSQMILSMFVEFPTNKHGRPECVAVAIAEAIEEIERKKNNCCGGWKGCGGRKKKGEEEKTRGGDYEGERAE